MRKLLKRVNVGEMTEELEAVLTDQISFELYTDFEHREQNISDDHFRGIEKILPFSVI